MAIPILDITLAETYNVFYLSIGDISEYPIGWNVTNPNIEITPPGFPKVSVAFTPKQQNFYKSNMLGITCDVDQEGVPLPDGLYKVKYSISPNIVYHIEKSFMRVNSIMQQYGQAFLQVDMTECCNSSQKMLDMKKLATIHALIQGSIAAANNCDGESAYKYYFKAQQLLTNFLNNCKY